ncbi:hypothetical protein [Pseudomonas sp. H9]|uniref:hypothetical protein n=1 Tax=Pseudomonas sp. H9 TaxID=483968 RepID=UPI001057BF24|nr:hypothetical protein [Pseudomonas sp. H9]TDF79928.1 hypothetical protein E1573_20640 [Pseudomonas sp. H9]
MSASPAIELLLPALPGIHIAGIGLHSATRLHARIAIQPPMEAGDLITLFWGQRFVAAHTLQAAHADDYVELRIPAGMLHNGVQRLHYRVFKPGQRPLRSPERQVLVKLDCPGGNDAEQHLQPLQLDRRLRHEGLCLDTLSGDLQCSLAPYRNMAEGDQITVRWGDLRLDLAPLNRQQIGRTLQVEIPRALIEESGADPHLELSYCILDRVGNRSQWAPSTALRVFAG